METMGLKEFVLWLMAGGSGFLVFWLLENVSWLKALAPDYKRYVAWGLTALIPTALWGFLLLMSYEPLPATWQAAVERVFAVIFVAFTVNQGTHGVAVLGAKRRSLE